MGVCTSAYPVPRLSHCPSTRISNAASPRQEYYTGIMAYYTMYAHMYVQCTHQVDVPLPYLLVDFKTCEIPESEDYVSKRLSKKISLQPTGLTETLQM